MIDTDDYISRRAVLALVKDIYVPTGNGEVYKTRSIDPQEVRELPPVPIVPLGELQPVPPNHVKKYVIEKEGCSSIVVNLTEREARVIEKFLDWACIDDNFCVESVEEYYADEWGKE